MKSRVYQESYLEFINQLHDMRPEHHKWAAIVLKSSNNNNEKSVTGEMLQVMEFHFNGQETIMLSSLEKKRVFVIIKNEKDCALSILESSIVDEFSTPDVKVELGAPLDRCVDRLCALIKDCLPNNDIRALVALKRLARLTRIFMIYTNDHIVRDRMTLLLQHFGNVITCTTPITYFESYKQYAPNAVFVDADILPKPKTLLYQKTKNTIDDAVTDKFKKPVRIFKNNFDW
jgi:hypothetical protein